IAKMRAEGVKMDGTPVMTVLTFDAVQSAEQAAAEQKESKPSVSGGLGGIAGGLMRRAAQKKSDSDQTQKGRAREKSSTTGNLRGVTDVSAADVAGRGGLKEKKKGQGGGEGQEGQDGRNRPFLLSPPFPPCSRSGPIPHPTPASRRAGRS